MDRKRTVGGVGDTNYLFDKEQQLQIESREDRTCHAAANVPEPTAVKAKYELSDFLHHDGARWWAMRGACAGRYH